MSFTYGNYIMNCTSGHAPIVERGKAFIPNMTDTFELKDALYNIFGSVPSAKLSLVEQ